jgi:hypothetical protein
MAGVLGLLTVLATAEGVFARTAEVMQFLSGTRWPRGRLLVAFQHRCRAHLIKRGYGLREVSSGTGHIRPANRRCEDRANRYPQGGPARPHDDGQRLVDVPLERATHSRQALAAGFPCRTYLESALIPGYADMLIVCEEPVVV